MSTTIGNDWIDYLKQTGNYEHYDGTCDCYQCRQIREGYQKWKNKTDVPPDFEI